MEVLRNSRNWWIALAIIWLIQILVFQSLDSSYAYFVTIILYAGINITLATSLNLISGFTGLFSIGHAGFMSVGAYTAAFLTLWFQPKIATWTLGSASGFTIALEYGVFIFTLYCGGLIASFSGWIVGLPSLRLKGDYLAIVTLGFGEIIRVVFLNIDAVGGARGMIGIPGYSNFGIIYTCAVACLYFLWRLIRSRQGRAFLAIREDEIAAEAMGVDLTQTKVRSFVLGSFWAGIAGGLFAHQLRYINPQSFDFNRSFEIIIMVVLGGMGSLSGSVVAAVLLTVLKEALRPLQEITKIDLRMVIYSLMLILLMLTRPHGLFGRQEIFEVLPSWWAALKTRFLNNNEPEART